MQINYVSLNSIPYSFIQSFNKYFLSTYYVLGPVLGTENTVDNKKDQVSALTEVTF